MDEKYALFPVELAKEMLRSFRALQASGLLGPGRIEELGKRDPRLTETPWFFTNQSGETIPPYACMQVVGTEEIGGQNYLIVNKPVDTTGTAGPFVFNGHREVANGEEGLTAHGRWVRATTDGTTSNAGERWQPVVADWTIEQASGGPFAMAGEDDIAVDCVKICIDGGSGGGATIEFEIISIETAVSGPYTGLQVATVEVHGAPCNRTSLIGTEVDVVDHSGCIFDLPEVDLVGVRGWAFEGVYLSLDAEAEIGELTSCHWAALNRCCADGEGV